MLITDKRLPIVLTVLMLLLVLYEVKVLLNNRGQHQPQLDIPRLSVKPKQSQIFNPKILPIKLIGIMMQAQPRAVFQFANHQQKILSRGDCIFPGIVVQTIQNDGVILKRGKQQAKLQYQRVGMH